MEDLWNFLEGQRLLVLATGENGPWICNVYYVVDNDFHLYFVSGTDTRHGEAILQGPRVAFSVAWFNPDDYKDRKAVQGEGECVLVENEVEVRKAVALYNQAFPDSVGRITEEWILDTSHVYGMWKVTPGYMKFWNDALYGEEGVEEFRF